MYGTTFLLAVREIRRHLLRSFLTILGIVIGVWAVVTMVTLGQGATAAVKEQISSLGANVLQIRPGQGFGRGGGGPQPPDFKIEDLDAIRSQIVGVTAVAPLVQSSGTAVYNAANWSTTINGTNREYFLAQPWTFTSGRSFSSAEEQAGKAVCIIGNTVRNRLFRGVDPVGKRFRIKSISCEIIGTLASKGQGGFGNDQDDIVLMPYKAVQRRMTGSRDVRTIMVSVDDAYDSQRVQASLRELLRERRHLTSGVEDDFNIFDTKQISDTLSGTTQILTSLLGAVAAVSLLVGGIGIMNIMLASVFEQTREIGVRRAVGALRRDIRMQFLIESFLVASSGGLLGVLLGFIISHVVATSAGWPTVITPFAIILATGVSGAVGLFSGLYPAVRASGLDPIEALQHH